MLRIRLTRVGKKNSPAYRVVIADKRRAVKGKFIEIVGHYNPTLKPKEVVINKERALFWMENGAQPSDTVRNLMCDLGILDKKDKIQKTFGKELTKKAIKEGPKEEPKAAETPVEETPSETAEAETAPEEAKEAPAVETTAEEPTDSESTLEAPEAEVEATEEVAEETEAESDEKVKEDAASDKV